jgi:hypothetical protein
MGPCSVGADSKSSLVVVNGLQPDFGKQPCQHRSRSRNVGLPKLNQWKFNMKTAFTPAEKLARSLARYIAERPSQADSLIHWPSFAHCFADAFAGAAEQDIRDVLTAFEHAGWLTADSAGHRITQEAMLLARSGRLPPLQRN